MNSWKVILATIVIFGTGVITGGLLVNYVDRGHVVRPRPGNNGAARRYEFPPPGPEQRRLEFVRNIARRLKLTSKQRTRIEVILHESQERTKKIWLQVAPQMRAEMARVRGEIRAELTPKQRQEFEELIRRPRHPSTNRPPRNDRRNPAATNAGAANAPLPLTNAAPADP